MVARRLGSRLHERPVPMGWFGLPCVLVRLGLVQLGFARLGCTWLGLALGPGFLNAWCPEVWVPASWTPGAHFAIKSECGDALPERLISRLRMRACGRCGGPPPNSYRQMPGVCVCCYSRPQRCADPRLPAASSLSGQ